MVCASNDGVSWGFPTAFSFQDLDSSEVYSLSTQRITLLSGQLRNLGHVFASIQRMESELRREIQKLAGEQIVKIAAEGGVMDFSQLPAGTRPGQLISAVGGKSQGHRSKLSVQDREIRIFLSSTFKDMQEERNEVMRIAIPHLRSICMERDVLLNCIDLRWGVTEAQTSAAATLLMCLREIDKCNAFVGMMGERYGWCKTKDGRSPQDKLLLKAFEVATKEFPWINDFTDRSVTEVEMRMVVENKHSGNVSKAAWFFLRDPYYIEHVPSDNRDDFQSEGEFEHKKLTDFKTLLNVSGYPVMPYNRPSHLAELFLEQLKKYIDEQFPPGMKLSALQSERFKHNTFARNFTNIYLPKENYYTELDKYIAEEKDRVLPLIVEGEIGTGKSALLANWASRYSDHHPEDIVVTIFVGCSPSSSQYHTLLYRILEEIKDFLSISDDLPPEDNTKIIITEFPRWLDRVMSTHGRNHRLVILIDSISSLDPRENAKDLVWLPNQFPRNVRVIISSSPSA